MSINRVSTLTDSDTQALLEMCGGDIQVLIDAVKSGTLPEGINADDALAFIFETVGTTSFDPDDPYFAEYLEDENVISMLNEFYNLNYANEDASAMIQDIQSFLESSGQSTGFLDTVARTIEDYKTKYPDTKVEDDEMVNLLEFFKKYSPGLYLMLYAMQQTETIEDGISVMSEYLDDISKERQDLMDELESIDAEDPDGNARIQVINNQLGLLNSKESAATSIMSESLLKPYQTLIQAAADMMSSENRTISFIIQS